MLLMFILGVATGCASNSDKTPTADSCVQQVDSAYARIAECRPVTDEQRQAAIAQCESAADAIDPREAWRPEFRASVDDCSATLSCEQFVEDLDDICYPVALAEGAAGLLVDTTIATCVSGGTEDCELELAMDRETGTNVVSRCFRRWAECADQRNQGEPYWTEDHCGSLIALTDEHRVAAGPCIELGCTEVSACLTEAGAFNF
jgi:hypothetical protein